MPKLLFSLFFFLFSIATATAWANHTGRVFDDCNGNGVQDSGEAGIWGVIVSDGLNVVQTDRHGAFSLPGYPGERFVFITTPSGYRTDNNHYRRISKGTTYLFGVQHLPQSRQIANDGSHCFLHISDTEVFNAENHGDWISNLQRYAYNERAAFIIHTGDICYENGLKSHINLMNTQNMDCPVFYCIGNHDLVKGEYGEELFESVYGPVYYSFEMGNTHYIVTPMLGGDHAPGYTKEDVYRWMKNDLELVPARKSVVVFNHDLLTNGGRFIYGINDTEFIDLNKHNLKAWIYGHWHINYMKKQGDVYSISTATLDKGGIDHSTSAFRMIHVGAKGDISSQLRYTYINKRIRIASLTNNRMPVTASGSLPLSVNVYSSESPVKEVTYTCLANGKPLKNKGKLKQQSDWNWRTEIPRLTVKPGEVITLKVTATFDSDETTFTESSFPYEPEQRTKVRLDEDWKNLLGNQQHTGTSRAQLTTPLSLVWSVNVGANLYMSSPLIYKDVIYVASVDENLKGEGAVFALEGNTGKLLWKYPVRNSIKNSIAIDNGYVYAQDAQGYLYAIDAATGRLAWEKQLAVEGLPAVIEGLVAADGVVYAGTGKGLCASNGATGESLWTNTGWRQGEGTTSTWSLNNQILVSGAQWRALYANDAITGKLLWQVSENGLRNRGASPAFHGNLLYLISENSMFVLDANTGHTIVRKPLPFSVDVTSTPLLTDKEIIFGTAKEGLAAINKETFEAKWTFKTSEALIYTAPYTRKEVSTIETSPILAGNTVYVGASDGTIYGIDKETGKMVWNHVTGAPVFGSVAASGNTLIATDFAGNVYAFAGTELAVNEPAGKEIVHTFRGIYADDPQGREGLCNPERGFRLEVAIDVETGDYLWNPKKYPGVTSYLDEQSLLYAADSISLVQSYFYLTGFVGRDLTEEAFRTMDIYLNALRKTAKKAVLRFAYESDFNGRAALGPTEAELIRHTVQLKPFLEKNKDVIQVVQAGMIGAWGEWHSSYRGLENSEQIKRNVLQSICNMTPKERAVQIRVPEYKNLLDKSSLDYKRVSFHDDFIVGKKHRWDGEMSEGTPAYKQIVSESLLLPVDGELPWGTWSMNEDPDNPEAGWIINGLETARRLSAQHFTSLSAIHNYKEKKTKDKYSMMYWKETPITEDFLRKNRMPVADGYFRTKDGTMAERNAFEYIRDHLGYRIELQKLLVSQHDNTLHVDLSLINRGFSTLFNEHSVYLVALNRQGEVLQVYPVDVDVHSWQPCHSTDTLYTPLVHHVKVDIPLPTSTVLSDYQLGLWIPDGSERLKYNPRFAIRCANGDVEWLCTRDGKYGINVFFNNKHNLLKHGNF